jgi:Ca2+-binding EF-hand superfamily protein
MASAINGMSSGMSAAALKQMQDQMFKAGDKNGDGTISKDELSQVSQSSGNQSSTNVATLFSQLDSDSDGAISRLESDAAIAQAGQQMQAQGTPPPGPPPGPPPSASSSSESTEDSSDSAAIFDAMDTNKDGTVSLAELTAALRESEESSTTSFDPETLLSTIGTALQSGDISSAKEALTALQQDVASRNGGQNDPFSKDLQSLSDSLESGDLSGAQSVLAGIQEKMSAGPPDGGGMESGGNSSQDTVTQTLQALIDALDKNSSSDTASGSGASDSLKSLFTTALKSYMQQSSGSYALNTTSSTTVSATA